jgi:kexin
MKTGLPYSLLFLAALTSSTLAAGVSKPARRDYASHEYYVMQHDPRAPGRASPDECASALGVEIVDRAGELKDHWLVRAPKADTLSRRAGGGASRATDSVEERWEALRKRAASGRRSMFSSRGAETQRARRIAGAVPYLEKQVPRQRIKRDDSLLSRAPPPIVEGGQGDAYNASSSHDVAIHFGFADPEFQKQWHLVNNDFPEHAMNATGLWDMGITGEGIISALVDDGLDYNSDDLAANFVSGPLACYKSTAN